MKLRYNGTASVTYEEAKERLLAKLPTHVEVLTGEGASYPPSFCAHAIWPGHPMTPQGAALAVSPLLKRMEREGVIEKVYSGYGGRPTGGGWVKV